MDSLRVVLVIIGVVIILALLGHGLWTIRKNNQVAKDKREQLERKRRRTPDDLFSQADEVSDSELHDPLQPRPARARAAVHVEQAKSADSISRSPSMSSGMQERIEPDLFDALADDFNVDEANVEGTNVEDPREQMEIDLNDDEFALRQQTSEQEQTNVAEAQQTDLLDDEEPRVLSADESHIIAADEMRAELSDHADVDSESFSAVAPDDEQIAASDAPSNEQTNQPEAKSEEQFEVITLFVTGDIQGAILLQMTAELGLKYGEMEIFHRHAESSGHGPVLFSVANMFNPGTFEINHMERFETQGLVLFMTLPLKSDGHQAFTMMYNAANKIADAMPRAAVLDGNRNPVTKQSVQHTYQRIREFERKQRLQKPSTQW